MVKKHQDIKAVLFDLHGVLTNAFIAEAARDFCDEFGVHPLTLSEVVAKHSGGIDTGRKTEREFFTQVAHDLPVDFTGTKLRDWFDRADRHHLKLDQEMWALKERLELAGYVVALATNLADGLAKRVEDIGLFESFDYLFVSSRIGLMKPWPEYFRHIKDELGFPYGTILLIDDDPVNVESALTLKMQAVLHVDAISTRRKLREYGLMKDA